MPRTVVALRLCVVCLLLSQLGSAQQPSPPPSLVSILTPNFRTGNAASQALFPPATANLETPLFIRLTLLFALSRYEIAAACHPTALSFFGVRDSIPPALCTPVSRITITSYLNLRLHQQQFPLLAPPYAAFLRDQGLTPFNTSTDPTTDIGFSNALAARANAYFSTDGWNSQGDTRSFFRRPYSDPSYRPLNPPLTPPLHLPRPLRWQPLTEPARNNPGAFVSQVHVVPQLASVTPLTVSPAHLAARRTRSPYRFPNLRRRVSRADRNRLAPLIAHYLNISQHLTPPQRFSAFWWDNKAASLGIFRPTLSRALGLTETQDAFLRMAEVTAQYDATLVVWREKLRHDAVRPTTIIRRLLAGATVRVFVDEQVGVADVPVEEVESLVRTQPHSEYPSASAAMCRATFEAIEFGYRRLLGRGVVIPPLVFPAAPGAFGVDVGETVFVNLTLGQANEDCARSRLYAGVHFGPAVRIGDRVGRGLGRIAVRHVSELVEGRVPEHCPHCVDV